MAWNEARLHDWLKRRRRPALLRGSEGHDAAVLGRPRGKSVVCVDACIEGVHFDRETTTSLIGRKAAGRALSDLAATAASPTAILLSLTAPAEVAEERIRSIIQSVDRWSTKCGAELVGGDLSCAAGGLRLVVTAMGELIGSKRPPGRDRAKPGQLILLSGPVGGSLLGRHLRIRPLIELGQFLHASGASAMMDVSDGLALDLNRIAKASDVRVDLNRIPAHADARRLAKSSGKDPLEHALNDGEDHELLASIDPGAWNKIEAQAKKRFPKLAPVGTVRRGSGLYIRSEEGLEPWDGRAGWIHGAG